MYPDSINRSARHRTSRGHQIFFQNFSILYLVVKRCFLATSKRLQWHQGILPEEGRQLDFLSDSLIDHYTYGATIRQRNEFNRLKIPNSRRHTSWPYTSVAEESKQRFPGTNLVGGECGTWTSNDWGQIPQTNKTTKTLLLRIKCLFFLEILKIGIFSRHLDLYWILFFCRFLNQNQLHRMTMQERSVKVS